ncbi:MAG: prepilin-type N-terminal cleavage/methylation domain-containing protein [Thermus sp.]|jgi:type II secretion system protein J|uniref:Prepilin-type N-terminal cleavage/methylation domain-containing protein n=1 Tax=Thermus antranikianii TaxID=88190 RepID=A0ABY7RRQ1_9DEIN|nr:prepilin-type N-terminal cleavage/methylation domain-containing protein [Thermus antranikianii]GBD18237.1 hypothetical protein HRbin27_00730 [bacterium HR27]
MKRNHGFSLVELLVALAILGLLLGAVLAFTQSSSRLERGQRALALLAEDLSLTATVLAREVYLAGYQMQAGNPLVVQGGNTLTLRFFCEGGMEIFCSTATMNQVRTVQYKLDGGTLYWGVCPGVTCTPTATHPVLDGVLHFRIAYLSGGNWSATDLTVNAGPQGTNPKVEALALYLLVQSPLRTGARGFTPGDTIAWTTVPNGNSLKAQLDLPSSAGGDGRPVAERLVLVQTPNLMR